MADHQTHLTREAAEVLALRALAYVIGNEALRARLLDLTGLDGELLRKRAGSPEVLIAALDFLAGNDADLVACATAIDADPAAFSLARRRIAA